MSSREETCSELSPGNAIIKLGIDVCQGFTLWRCSWTGPGRRSDSGKKLSFSGLLEAADFCQAEAAGVRKLFGNLQPLLLSVHH